MKQLRIYSLILLFSTLGTGVFADGSHDGAGADAQSPVGATTRENAPEQSPASDPDPLSGFDSPEPLKLSDLQSRSKQLSDRTFDRLMEFPFSEKFGGLSSTAQKNAVGLLVTAMDDRWSDKQAIFSETLSDKEVDRLLKMVNGWQNTTGTSATEDEKDELRRLARRMRLHLEDERRLRKEDRVTEDGKNKPRKFSEFSKAVHQGPGLPPRAPNGLVALQPIEVQKEKILWVIFGESVCQNGAMANYRGMAMGLPNVALVTVDSLSELESKREEIRRLINDEGYRHVMISGHGSPYGMTIGGGNNNLVPQNSEWFGQFFRGATDLRMISCELGLANNVIRGVAKGADASVTGSTALVYGGNNGSVGWISVPADSNWVSIVPHARRGEAANDPSKSKYLASYLDPTKPPEGVFPKEGGGVRFVDPGTLFRDQGPRVGPDGKSQSQGDDLARKKAEEANRRLADAMKNLGEQTGNAAGSGAGGGAGAGAGSGGDRGAASMARGLANLAATQFNMPQQARDPGISDSVLQALLGSRNAGPRGPINFDVGPSAKDTIDRMLNALYGRPVPTPNQGGPGPGEHP